LLILENGQRLKKRNVFYHEILRDYRFGTEGIKGLCLSFSEQKHNNANIMIIYAG